MTDASSSFTTRPAQPSDDTLLTEWSGAELVAWINPSRLGEELATGNYRPEWSWLAVQCGQPIGRALWWGRATADRPTTLDCLLVADTVERPEDVGTALIRAGLESFGPGPTLELKVDVDANWMSVPAAVHAVRWRERAARAGGFRRTAERISFAQIHALPPSQPLGTKSLTKCRACCGSYDQGVGPGTSGFASV